jgi:sugar lactone lactonase YvrE
MSSHSSLDARVLLRDLALVESPRWHENRLWLSHWGMEQFIAVDLDGTGEVVASGPSGLGWATDWLPDGRRLITGNELMREEPDGTLVRHADLSHLTPYGWSEIVVDGRGNVYVNSINFDFLTEGVTGEAPGIIAVVRPDGSTQQVADHIAFPNGMVVTPDNHTLIVSESFTRTLLAYDIAADGTLSNRRPWATNIGPDGICLDADGAVWTSTGPHTCGRVVEGGEVLETVEIDRDVFACMLGGPDRRTLFIMAAEWRGTDRVDEVLAARTGQVLVADAPAPGVGWP